MVKAMVKTAVKRVLLIRSGVYAGALTGACAGVLNSVYAAALTGALAGAVSAEELIAYQVVLPSGYSQGTVNGETAYFRKRRGALDSEPMQVIAYFNKPSDLPPPTVVAPSPLPLVQEFRAGKVLSKADLKGEDAVFQRIFDDQEKERCLWQPESCQQASGIQQRREFVLPKP
ncbi:hypothetical protein [Neptunomonas qingdaonensis]|uniref:Lipoprotein n=1 Tax=Neptunomonas qingdaonensis TaxID=1045558 RepID=A0A1I2TPP5_9GAMM|nr:hypothetical protein [Neptunomonas qingdaonensis]SFG64436.1 hypothetical protein SAMN05216175_11061 [Neptunomonas qingdaonensis]